jgi:CRISPR associated protein Cas1
MKPLYLNTTSESWLSLDEGPSLVLSGAAQPTRRFPLRVLARIIVNGNVRIESAAISACLREGITIAFMGSAGPVGFALPAAGERGHLAFRIEKFLDRSDAIARYQDWRRSAERREISATLYRLGLNCRDLRPQAVEPLMLCSLPTPQPDTRALRGIAAASLGTRVARWLANRNIDARTVAVARPGFRLIADCAGLLSWSFYADWMIWMHGKPPSVERDWMRSAASCVESNASRDEQRIGGLMGGFCGWLGGVE